MDLGRRVRKVGEGIPARREQFFLRFASLGDRECGLLDPLERRLRILRRDGRGRIFGGRFEGPARGYGPGGMCKERKGG